MRLDIEVIIFMVLYTSAFELGQDLIVNGGFQQPSLLPGQGHRNYNKNISGWTCTNICQINNCQPQINFFINIVRVYGNCKGQVLDMGSNQAEKITQVFQATNGQHLLNVQFYLPIVNAVRKTFVITLNQQVVYTFTPQTEIQADAFNVSISKLLIEGPNNITFSMKGVNDACGFRLSQVSMRRILNLQIEKFFEQFFNNFLLVNIISFPGSRILIGSLSNTLISFDRMQLYYYHNRRYSYYTTVFFRTVSSLLGTKNELSLTTGKLIIPLTTSALQNFIAALDYKKNYINTKMLSRSQNGYGFVSNNTNLVVYSLPFFTVLLTVLFLIFWLTFDFKISKFVRKYSFFGVVFLLMVCQGNIEQYSFYCFGEFITMFSADYRHKAVNCVIVGFFLIVLIASTAFSFLVWGRYRKKAVHFIDGFKLSVEGVAGFTFSDGFIALVFGAFHQLFLSLPNLQLLALGLLQTVWIAVQLLFLKANLTNEKFFIVISILEGILRISLQISLYSYANIPASDALVGKYLNDKVHLSQIFLFISLRIICLLGYAILSAYQCFTMFKVRKRKLKRKQKKGKTVGFKHILIEKKFTFIRQQRQ